MITEGISCSSRGQKRARTANSDSTSTDEDNNNIILHRFASLVELVEQSKEENGTGKWLHDIDHQEVVMLSVCVRKISNWMWKVKYRIVLVRPLLCDWRRKLIVPFSQQIRLKTKISGNLDTWIFLCIGQFAFFVLSFSLKTCLWYFPSSFLSDQLVCRFY